MQVYILNDYEAGTWIEKDPAFKSYSTFLVDLPEEFLLKEQSIRDEYNDMQSTLYKIWEELRRAKRLKDTETGIKPKGFN